MSFIRSLFGKKNDDEQLTNLILKDIPQLPSSQIPVNVEQVISEDIEQNLGVKLDNFIQTQRVYTPEGEEYVSKIGKLASEQLFQRLLLDKERDKQVRVKNQLEARIGEYTSEECVSNNKTTIRKLQRGGFIKTGRNTRKANRYKKRIKGLEKKIERLKKDRETVDRYLDGATPIKSILNNHLIYGFIMSGIIVTETLMMTSSLYGSDLSSQDGKLPVFAFTFVLTLGQVVTAHIAGIKSIKLGNFSKGFKAAFGFGIFVSLMIAFYRQQAGSPVLLAVLSIIIFLLEVYISQQRYMNFDYDGAISKLEMRIVNRQNKVDLLEDDSEITKKAIDMNNLFEHTIQERIDILDGKINEIDRLKDQIKDAVSIEVFKGKTLLKSKINNTLQTQTV